MYDPARTPLPARYLPVHPFDNGEMTVRDEHLARLPLPRRYGVERRVSFSLCATASLLPARHFAFIERGADQRRRMNQLGQTRA